jgi:hypothetical protein
MRVIPIAVIVAGFALASCGLLSDAGVNAAKDLKESADQLGGKAKEISDQWSKQADKICELTDTKISELQQSSAAACAAYADARQKQQCEELNKKANALIEDIRSQCRK